MDGVFNYFSLCFLGVNKEECLKPCSTLPARANIGKLNPRSRFKYVWVFFLLTVLACDRDEMIAEEPDLYNVEIGSFSLFPSSIEKLPYSEKIGALFIDSSGTQMKLDVEDLELFRSQLPITLFKYDVYEQGDTVRYTYFGESKSTFLSNDTLDLFFSMSLRTSLLHRDPESRAVADVLDIFCRFPGGPGFGSIQVFTDIVDQRAWPDSVFSPEKLSEFEIIGRTFNDVLTNNFSDPKSKVYYNYAFGIVAFQDHTGNWWRFERFLD